MGADVRPLLAVVLVAARLLPGCVAPYKVTVDAGALARTGIPWTRADHGTGPLLETTYTADPSSQPPYPGTLQLFALRDGARRSNEELLALTRSSVENATAENGIAIQGAGTQGTRTLRNGLATQWFALEGTVSSSSALFQEQTRVRILGEAGFDGRSGTHVIAVAIAQVESITCVLPGACQTRTDLRNWTAIVGDTKGSIDDAVSQNGLIDNLVSHG